MIIKSFELKKIKLENINLILLFGKNNGLKKDITNQLINKDNKVSYYDEKDILEKQNIFLESLMNKSLFDEKNSIIIKRATDKIVKTIEEINQKKIEDLIIITSDNLEKRSKLRSLFEKDKKLICIPVYPDNNQTLSVLCANFLKNKKISISQANINLIVEKCNGDREILFNELNKIDLFTKKGNKINSDNILKLINLSEDHSISELIDNCLAKNMKKIIKIFNENNFNSEDCVLITRIFLNKAKKILQLSSEFEKNKDIDFTISTAKPIIFWKDKEITKQQIYKWKPENIRKLIYKLNHIELLIKKNLNNSVKIMTDFILEQSSTKTNN